MVWRVLKIDPTTNVAAEAVLKAFEAARGSGRPSVECYRAGVEAWRCQHPGQTPQYTAKQAGFEDPPAPAQMPIEEIIPLVKAGGLPVPLRVSGHPTLGP